MSYDLGYRIPGAGGTFESADQWRAVVGGLVRRAAEEVVRYRRLVPSLDAAARECLRLERERIEHVRANQGREATASWSTWNAAVASGLAGDVGTAVRYFDAVAQSPAEPEYWLPVLTGRPPGRIVSDITTAPSWRTYGDRQRSNEKR